jgi:tetratricopeptide (TPR) repeat protein
MAATFPLFKRAKVVGVLAAAVVSAGLLAGCASAPATPPSAARYEFPAPNTGPGRPRLEQADQRLVNEGWNALLSGDTVRAEANAARVGNDPASDLLSLQATLVANRSDASPGLERLTSDQPDYAAAWLTLSVAAERAGDERTALTAAIRGSELWPEDRWIERRDDLKRQFVGARIEKAGTLLASGAADASLDTLEPALELEPDNRDAVVLKARALIELGQPDRAEAALSTLPRDSETVRLSGKIAEQRGDLNAAMRIYGSLPDDPESVLAAVAIAEQQRDWQAAMRFYSYLPDDNPEKEAGLRRAKLRWRLSVMPDYVHEAMNSPDLSRAQLAVILVRLAPKVESMAGGQVPLLSDIMTLPSQAEILTATRLGLVDCDELLHRFHPHRQVTALEARTAVENLVQLLGVGEPRWCTFDSGTRPCVKFVDPVSGSSVANVVMELAARGGNGQ